MLRITADACSSQEPGRITAESDAPWRVSNGGSIFVIGKNDNIRWDGSLLIEQDAVDLQLTEIDWEGATDASLLTVRGGQGTVNGCSFTGRESLVVLDGVSHLAFSENELTATSGSALVVAPAGTGADNRITGNHILATVAPGEAAVSIGNPLQTLRNNRITSHGAGDALRIVPHTAYGRHEWDNAGNRMVVSGNTTVAGQTEIGRGVVIGPLRMREPVVLANNTISGFALGATLNEQAVAGSHGDTYLVLRNWIFTNNVVGLELGEATLQNVEIKTDDGQGNTALRFNRPSGVRPRVSGIQLEGYATGIEVTAGLKTGNYLEDIAVKSVTELLSLPSGSKAGLYFPDGVPKVEAAATPMNHQHGNQHGHNDHANYNHHNNHDHHAPPSRARMLLPADHPAITPACEPLNKWQSCPERSLGELVVTTGFGQSDPVHEHGRVLGDILLGEDAPIPYSGSGQRTEILLGTGVEYLLQVPGFEDIYDLSLSWTSISDQPLELRIPYPHDAPWLFRALGGELVRCAGTEELKHSLESAWAYDTTNDTIHLRLFADGGEQEIVLYNRAVDTELYSEGKPVALSIADADAGATTYTINLSPGTPYELTITDIYGSPRRQFNGHAPASGQAEETFTPHGRDVPGWYFLTVGGETFKGPYVPRSRPRASELHTHPPAKAGANDMKSCGL